MVQDEVTWVLDTIREAWPGEWPTDDQNEDVLYRINRDEPKILETGERTRSVDLSTASALGVSLVGQSRTPVGTEFDARVETTLDCRLEGLTTHEFGHIESANDAKQLALYAQHALDTERSYPTIEYDDPVGAVEYHTLFVEEPTDRSHEYGDQFRWDWTVRLVGYAELP